MKCLRTPPRQRQPFFSLLTSHGGALFPGDSKFERLAPNEKRGKIISHPIPPDPTLERYPSAPASPVGPMGDFLGDGSATLT